MSDAASGAALPRTRLFGLPGFFPDALPYAARTTIALLLSYGLSFYAQVPTASSAGITVGIIAQASSGMALSKAFYRVAGTVIGCGVALLLGSAFAQDRTMLLFCFALWMGACAAAAALLRDFRSYGAAISGYTVAIIAIGGIDDPDGLLLSSLNRTVAILIGIGCVALVNSLLGGTPALTGLVAGLRRERERVVAFAVEALEGRGVPDDLELTQRVSAITALQSEAGYAAAEQSNGRLRRRGAQVVIGSLLTAVSASRTIAGVLSPETPAAVREYLAAVAASLRDGTAAPDAPGTDDPFSALLLERADSILRRMRDTEAGLTVLTGGAAALPEIVLRPTHDVPAALLSAARVILAFGLAATFVVLSGWPGATLVLVQQAAFVGLLGASPTPTAASKGFLIPLLPIALVVGLVEFLLLPLASGFVPFALLAGGTVFLTALLGRQRRLAPLAPAGLIYVTLLLSPSNPQTFLLDSYLNTTLQVGLAVVFTLLTFLLILPVSPKRRLYRVVAAISGRFERARRSAAAGQPPAVAQAQLYDRLVRALTFLGRPTGARRALLSHLYHVGASEIAVHRARAGLAAMGAGGVGVAEAQAAAQEAAQEALARLDGPAMLRAGRALLRASGSRPPAAVLQAVSGLADLVFQEGRRGRVSRFSKLMIG